MATDGAKPLRLFSLRTGQRHLDGIVREIQFTRPLPQFVTMLLEAAFNFVPRDVELHRLLETATRLVRVRTNNPRPVKPARLFQNLQVVDVSHPERSILT